MISSGQQRQQVVDSLQKNKLKKSEETWNTFSNAQFIHRTMAFHCSSFFVVVVGGIEREIPL